MKVKGSDLLATLELMRRNYVHGRTDRMSYLVGVGELFEAKIKFNPETDDIQIGDDSPNSDEVIKCP